jgi:mannose-6-phosphate isomerase-like protein (cupin superfamily)
MSLAERALEHGSGDRPAGPRVFRESQKEALQMRHIQTVNKKRFFKVLESTPTAQAAMMILQPGQSTGEPKNEHPHSEQWLFVVSGSGKAAVNKRPVELRGKSLLVIHKGEVHQITNTGRRPLVTLNFYAPPAYTRDGELKDKA